MDNRLQFQNKIQELENKIRELEDKIEKVEVNMRNIVEGTEIWNKQADYRNKLADNIKTNKELLITYLKSCKRS
jgi:tyrosine-protein phosphatase YwqE